MPVTIKQALGRAVDLQAVSDSAQLETELLLAEALGCRRETLLAWPERELTGPVVGQFDRLLQRRRAGEPMAYILGRRDFWDFQLDVNAHVLIPRPETELLVEYALELLADSRCQVRQLADLGTGSGAIAIALARELPASEIIAVDLSAEALQVARSNAERLQVTNIRFQRGSWCEPLADSSLDMLLANPPYVAAGDTHLQQGDLRYEPQMALVAAEEGLADIKAIATQARRVLRPQGWLLLEHGYQQGAVVQSLLRECGYHAVECRKDYAGQDRLTIGQM